MKYVIDTVELKKRQYVIEAYTERAAIELMEDAEPTLQEIISDSIFNVHIINEYEYKHSPDYNEGHDLLPKQRELFDESNDIWRDD